ncbi:MAG TPA: sensor histidine kinase, partial [Flavisolibacter sp.]|nr:sensor histidine kinase [Flavisolibacter sp.]
AMGVSHRFLKSDGDWLWLESKGINHLDNPFIEGIVINSRDVTDRIRLQEQLNEEQLSKQREITAAVIKAQEAERSQIGLELHDNVNQILTTIKLYNEMFLSGYREDRELLKKSTHYLQECINEIRSISKRLSAPTLGNISLTDSIKELVESINLTNRLEIQYITCNLEDDAISQDLHLAIYRIVQEALNNIIKYADAKQASIEIKKTEDKLCVAIVDDGKGFDYQTKRAGIGITNMKTRADNLKGSFKIKSAVGKGCTIEICFPL